jgi:hypothetical protein
MHLRAGIVALCVAAAPSPGAAETRVVSMQPDSVSVTIYRDFFALITETRSVDLPAEAVMLEFDGVVETLIPQSAVIADVGRSVAESNYDFESLSPGSLLRKSIGKTVTLTRTNRATGKANQVAATVISANSGGVMFRTEDGNEALHCSGLPEKLTFHEIPDDLTQKPTLSIHLAAGTPGKRQVRVSYIAQGFGWAADYVAQVQAATSRMDLRGWLTLRNFTGARFDDAQVQVVAGRLNLLDAGERGSSTLGDSTNFNDEDHLAEARRERLEELQEELDDRSPQDVGYLYGCYPYGSAIAPREFRSRVDSVSAISADDYGGDELQEIIVTGFRASLAERENLADYQMYRVPWKTDLGARQTKQVAFLHKPEVTIERFYGVRIAADTDDSGEGDDLMPMKVHVGWNNLKADGLGEPLPGGIVRIFDRNGNDSVFAGDDRIEDTPVGVPSGLTIGRSPDVLLAAEGDDEPQPTLLSLLTRRAYMGIELLVTNAKSLPVLVEVRQGRMPDFDDVRVVDASLRPMRKAGDYAWRFIIPANGEQRLSYRVGGTVPDFDD